MRQGYYTIYVGVYITGTNILQLAVSLKFLWYKDFIYLTHCRVPEICTHITDSVYVEI